MTCIYHSAQIFIFFLMNTITSVHFRQRPTRRYRPDQQCHFEIDFRIGQWHFFRSIHQYRWILRVKNHRLASEYPCRNVRKFRASKFPQKGRHIKFHFLHFSNFSCLPVFLFFKLILWLASHLQEILSSRVQVMSRWRSAEIPLCDHFDCNLFSIFVIA